jgi:hypothetical protein
MWQEGTFDRLERYASEPPLAYDKTLIEKEIFVKFNQKSLTLLYDPASNALDAGTQWHRWASGKAAKAQ